MLGMPPAGTCAAVDGRLVPPITSEADMRFAQHTRRWVELTVLVTLVGGFAWPAAATEPRPLPTESAAAAVTDQRPAVIPDVLRGNAWLARNRRSVSTLAQGVSGYALAFMLTGQERYLIHARAGLDWIEASAADDEYGGYFGELRADGTPVDPLADKDVLDLASVGTAYALYFDATRDPEAEDTLLAIRDLLFERYYDASENRVKDALSYDLENEVDTGNDGGDITDLLVPGTGMFLPTAALLTDPVRRAQFKYDLRNLTESLISLHKNDAAPTDRWIFWGRTARFGALDGPQTDFGHIIESYAMIHNANQLYAERPWEGLSGDRTAMLDQARDDTTGRWNQRPGGVVAGDGGRGHARRVRAEADQLLAALDLGDGFAHSDQLSPSTGRSTDLRASSFGKDPLHAAEHALIMYLHGRALQDRPARLYFAFPEDQALTAVAKPYWFDAAGESRTDTGPLAALPGHDLVRVDFTGIGRVPREPYPPPSDDTAPSTDASLSPEPNAAGWHRGDVTVSLSATDDMVGVKEVHVRIAERTGGTPGVALVHPGGDVTLPALTDEGDYDVTFFAVDALGNSERPRDLHIRIDRTGPSVAGMPPAPCRLRAPSGDLEHVADVVGSDSRSGVGHLAVTGSPDAPGTDDVRIDGGSVDLRASHDRGGTGRGYTLRATVTDVAGNTTIRSATCVVPDEPDR